MISHLWKLPGLAAAGVVSLAVLVAAVATVLLVALIVAVSIATVFGVLMGHGLGLIA